MAATEVWASIQSRPHGSSGTGVSYYRAWAGSCPKRAQLDAELVEQGHQRENKTDSRGFSYFDVGVYYHLLHEIAIRGQGPDEAWDVSDALDVNFVEAMRLYHGWRKRFGSIEEKYACTVLGTEFVLPSSPLAAQQIKTIFHGDLTGRVDVAIEIHDPQIVATTTATEHSSGLALQPGVYLLDFKTAGTYSDKDYFKYTRDLQARCYLTLYNLEHKDRPARGMIFDQIIKHTNLSPSPVYDSKGKVKQHSSFHAYYQAVQPDDIPTLRSLVQYGMANMGAPRANPDACIGRFEVCPHLLSGICRGH